ncbi:unnamed protein product [Caretta caretta]
MNIADSLEKERADRREAQESHQEKEREMHQDIRELLRQQTQVLQTLFDLEVQQSYACLPLQSMDSISAGPPFNVTSWDAFLHHHSMLGDSKDTTAASHTLTSDLGSDISEGHPLHNYEKSDQDKEEKEIDMGGHVLGQEFRVHSLRPRNGKNT